MSPLSDVAPEMDPGEILEPKTLSKRLIWDHSDSGCWIRDREWQH